MHVFSTVPIGPIALERLGALPRSIVETLPPPHGPWAAPATVEFLLCKIPPENIHELSQLKLVQISSVGYEHLKHLNLGAKAYPVCNARGMFDTAITEWNLAMMINLTRDLRAMIRNQEAAHWEKHACFQQELRGKTIGIWGYGGIGRDTARLARAFGMTVHVMTRSGVRPRLDAYTPPDTGDPQGVLPHRVFVSGQEADFLASLDFLILALPHTKQSDGMIGATELKAMPRHACLLNPARGLIVQETALLQALREGWIAGAAIDTHYAYPLPAEHALWRFPNVILTPHISGADKSAAFPERMGDLFLQNVRRFLEGRPLLNLVTKREWDEA